MHPAFSNCKLPDKPTIAIVDDDSTTTLLFRSYLEPSYSVSTFNQCREALEWIDKAPSIDLILADLYMPEMGGFNMVKILRKRGKTRETPIMVVSGATSDEVRVRALTSGADDFICKPINPKELMARIELQLRRVKPPVVVNALRFFFGMPASNGLGYDWPPGSERRAERKTRELGLSDKRWR